MKIISRVLSLLMHKIVLILIVLFASLLRIFNLANAPVSLNQDEAVNGYDAYSLGTTLRDHHGNFMPVMLESFGDWASPVITYLTIPFVKLFGLSEFSVRLPVALLGVGALALIYVVVMQLFNDKKLALLASFLLAIMPWHITLSRWAIPPSILPFFVLLFLSTLLWAIKDKNEGSYIKFLLVGATAAIATYSYPTQKLFIPLLLCSISSFIFFKYRIQKIVLSGFIFYVILVSPIYIITLSNPDKYNSRLNMVSITHSGENIFQGFLSRYIDYFLPGFHFGTGDLDIMHHVPGVGSTYSFLSIFFYMGILTCFYIVITNKELINLNREKSLLLLVWLILFPIPASLTVDRNHLLRVVHGLPIVVLFVVLGFQIISSFFKRIKQKQMLFFIVMILGLFYVSHFSSLYFYKYHEQSKGSYQYGIKSFMSYILKNEEKFSLVLIDSKINQPYIYYLFYSKTHPHSLNYSEINAPQFPEKGKWNEVHKIGKYEFREIKDEEILNAREIYKVADEYNKKAYTQNRVWYRIYENQNKVWFVKRSY